MEKRRPGQSAAKPPSQPSGDVHVNMESADAYEVTGQARKQKSLKVAHLHRNCRFFWMRLESVSLPDAEGGENKVQNVVTGSFASKGVQLAERSVEVE
jgi:hypothetical protein